MNNATPPAPPATLSGYVTTVDTNLRRYYGKDWRNYSTRDAIDRHEREGWDAEKYVDYIAQKFNLTPLGEM